MYYFSHTSRLLCSVVLATSIIVLSSCSTQVPRKEAAGKLFPQVQGESLAGDTRNLPADLKGKPAVLLVGYAQKSQFDIDRWILGLKQLNTNVTIVEVPTIKGILPGMAADFISNGMRRGIPEEDWASVVTVFSDAGKIVEITGNENPNNARVFLLNSTGEIVWFFDRGYSADQVLELSKSIEKLQG